LREEQKEPLRRSIFRRLLDVPDGTPRAGAVVDWRAPQFVAFRACLAVGKAAGARRDEVSLPDDATFYPSRASRAPLTWRLNGIVVAAPSTEQLRGLTTGDAAIFTPPPSKADPFGLHFGNKPIWLPVTSAPGNAASALRDSELAVPVDAARRRVTPLFGLPTAEQPLRHSTVDRMLRDLLVVVVGPQDANKYSFHSCRVALACALLASGASHSLIQAPMLVRPKGTRIQLQRICT